MVININLLPSKHYVMVIHQGILSQKNLQIQLFLRPYLNHLPGLIILPGQESEWFYIKIRTLFY